MNGEAEAQKGLVDAGRLAQHTAHAERSIFAAAEGRLEAVERELAELRPEAITDPEKSQRYMDLIAERGTLQSVIANAQKTLGT